MLGRANTGKQLRRIMSPIASELGLNYDVVIQTPPRTSSEVVMTALLCGKSLLYAFTNTDEWPIQEWGPSVPKREARAAAKRLSQTLTERAGRDAISVITQGLGLSFAALWREAAANAADDAEGLEAGAAASEGIAAMVASAWPVTGYREQRDAVAQAAEQRTFDADNPDAMTNLRDYARTVELHAEGLAVALSDDFERYEPIILAPVRSYLMVYGTQLLASTSYASHFWGDLIRPGPSSHLEVIARARTQPLAPG